jgi:hypothetical protein
MNESQWQQRITDFCDILRLLWYHNPDSRRSNAGFPDLVIVGVRGMLYAELKAENGRVTAKQRTWHEALENAGAEVHVWRPSHWREVEQRLLEIAGKRISGRTI